MHASLDDAGGRRRRWELHGVEHLQAGVRRTRAHAHTHEMLLHGDCQFRLCARRHHCVRAAAASADDRKYTGCVASTNITSLDDDCIALQPKKGNTISILSISVC